MNPRPLDAPMNNESEFSRSSREGDCCTWNVLSLLSSAAEFFSTAEVGESESDVLRDGDEYERILDNISIFSSFSSSIFFSSRISASNDRTLSSSDSVYPRGKARRLSLSLVLHSNPTLAHCEQHGRIPSHLIFLLRHRSQA